VSEPSLNKLGVLIDVGANAEDLARVVDVVFLDIKHHHDLLRPQKSKNRLFAFVGLDRTVARLLVTVDKIGAVLLNLDIVHLDRPVPDTALSAKLPDPHQSNNSIRFPPRKSDGRLFRALASDFDQST
jgi:hypothetical protein